MNLTKHIQQAIFDTNTEHLTFSEYGISYAPEYLITVNIAKRLSDLNDKKNVVGVYLEWNIKDLIKEENLTTDDYIRDGKCDICVFFNQKNNAIIEVKNTVTNKGPKLRSVHNDIERIEYFLLNKDSTFNNSYVSFLVQAKDEEKVKIKANKFIEDMKKSFTKLDLTQDINYFKEDPSSNEESFLASVVLLIESKI